MTTGNNASSPLIETSNGFAATIYDQRSRISTNPKETSFLNSEFFYGSLDSNQPVATFPSTKTGRRAGSFLLDYYYRTHIIPSKVEFGNILSNQERNVEIWNAWFEQNLLSSITATGVQGLSLEDQPDPPNYFGALESKIYKLKALTSGPPNINGLFIFNFELDDYEPRLVVTGLRVLAFWPAANWNERIIERFEWLTDVMSSKNQKEQRVKIRQKPRRQMEFSCLVSGDDDRRLFENLLFSWQARVFGLPIWTDQEILRNNLAVGVMAIPCNTETRDYEIGSLVGIFLGSAHEISTITAVYPAYVEISAPTGKAWPRGSKVVPVRTARLTDSQPMVRETDSVLTFRVQFKLETPDFVPAEIESANYRGDPVLETPSNWREQITFEYKRDVYLIDFQSGVSAVDDITANPAMLSKYYWQADGRSATNALKKFLFARYGKLKPIWLPTLNSDITLTEIVGAGSQTLYVKNHNYTKNIATQVQRRDLRIKLKNGSIYYRRISQSFEESSLIERFIIDSPFGIEVSPAMVQKISFMTLNRLDADSLEFVWETNETIEVDGIFRSIRDDV